MGTTDFFKSAVDAMDKVTDILNVGRLIFYTSAGFCALLPVAMTLRMLKYPAAATYSTQFVPDLTACAKSGPVWLASLIFGFVIANLANAMVMNQLPTPLRKEIDKESYSYSYPRLFSGGRLPKEGTGTSKDYAAWLVSEYYRYVEIIVFIPYGILLSLPVYSLYSLLYLIRTSGHGGPLALHAVHFAFALWTLGTVVAWALIWPDFWVPRIAAPLYQDWVDARRSAIQGLKDFVAEQNSSQNQGDTQSSGKKP